MTFDLDTWQARHYRYLDQLQRRQVNLQQSSKNNAVKLVGVMSSDGFLDFCLVWKGSSKTEFGSRLT